MMWVYREAEDWEGRQYWQVGYFDPHDNEFAVIEQYKTNIDARTVVHYLNGGS